MRPTLHLALLSALLLPLASCRGSADPTASPSASAPGESAEVAAARGRSLPDADQHAPQATSGAEQPTVNPPTVNPSTNPSTGKPAAETAIFAAGCFWCIEAVLLRIDGVLGVESGYTGGTVDNPTYDQVCTGTTGHAESVRVQFDPRVLPYGKLCDWFFHAHDPTTRNRQGNDLGTQYRSAIFYTSEAQHSEALAAKARAQKEYSREIVTEITKASTFWRAEGYHQNYFANNPGNPYCCSVIPPKLKKLGLDTKPAKAADQAK
jgi:peptide-methionine (S)-S-oxide reductase